MNDSIKLGGAIGIFISISIAAGLQCVGEAIKKQTKTNVVLTSGTAEKKVKSDIVEVKLTSISYKEVFRDMDRGLERLNNKGGNGGEQV